MKNLYDPARLTEVKERLRAFNPTVRGCGAK